MSVSPQIQTFLDTRQQAASDSETFHDVRRSLLACDKAEVLANFETHLRVADEEEHASAIAALASLYGPGATDTIIRWINDPSTTVRWVVCGCLHDHGDSRAEAALLDRLKHDADGQIRGVAASALGQIGAINALPDLYRTFQADLEVDELGHTPSSQAGDAITTVLRNWVSQQIQENPPRTFRETTRKGQLTGAVRAESIPFDADGRINRTLRFAHLPHSCFGPGCELKMDLQTSS